MRHMAVILSFLAACGEAPNPDGFGEVDVSVLALTLPGVSNAVYSLTMYDTIGKPLWTQTVDSATYGNGPGGDITYIGPCDASGTGENRVRLEILDLVPLDPMEWANPGPMDLVFTCQENADTQVEFNVTILRSAQAGFADVSVNFEDIFCSAKVDCATDNNTPLELLFDDNGERMPSGVLAITCANEPGSDPHIYLNDPRIVCGGSSWPLNPTALGTTQLPPAHPAEVQAVTAGGSLGSGWEQIYWTLTFGNNPALLGPDCRLVGEFTASNGPLAANTTPAGGGYPIVEIDVPLTNTNGGPACTQHPLNGGNGVDATYAQPTSFAHGLHKGPNGGVSF
jgi:hypothetical protein